MADPISVMSQDGGHDSANGHLRLEAMRSWLVNGVHLVDRRRRFGQHGRARELLVDDRSEYGASERWQALASALHRHTVRGGLSELSPEERRVITLAYLEGRTNREIAAMLGVSVTTARRRLWAALQRLEAYITGTGVWLTALVLAVVAYATAHAARLGRWTTVAAHSSDKAQRLTATVAAGAVATATASVVAFNSFSAMPAGPSHATFAPYVSRPAVAAEASAPTGWQTVEPAIIKPAIEALVATTTSRASKVAPAAATPTNHGSNGCHGNPTNAPPTVPVGPRGSHAGAPVTYPGKGGCKALGG